MGSLLEIFSGVFSTPTDYAQMLKKLSSFAFWEVFIITFILRGVPEVSEGFKSIESIGILGQVVQSFPTLAHLNAMGFLIAMLIAILSHAFHLHNKLANFLGIRELFDCKHIAFPLARLVNAPLTKRQREGFRAQRNSLMRVVFYTYASSRADNPVVDKHDIQHALSNWTWFWAFEEFAFYCVATALLLSFIGQIQLAGCFYMASSVSMLLGFVQYRRLPGYARTQIEQIANNVQAASAVRSAFDAL
jgi:hypothetical protein